MTRRLMRSCAAALLAVAGVAGGLSAAPFAPPEEDVVVFRRDRLTLDVGSMEMLSAQLLVLAKAQGGANEVDRRGVAQMLALALALKPGANEIHEFSGQFENGEQTPDADRGAVAKARARAWQMLGWLEAANAGEDAQVLARCLGDVMVMADPKHPRAEELRKLGERGAWDGWVKPLAAFTHSTPAGGRPAETTGDEPPEKPSPEPDEPAAPPSSIKLPAATLGTVVWVMPEPNKPKKLILMPLEMEATVKDFKDGDSSQSKSFSCIWINPKVGESLHEETKAFRSASEIARAVVENASGPMPGDVRMSFKPGTALIYRVQKDKTGISGALAVLMNAALTGTVPQGTVLGDIRADGSFRLPQNFWERLRSLSGGKGGRLVVPADAEPFISGVLALEDPGFFFDYEVLYAANFAQLVARTARVGDAVLADASARFTEIRSKRGSENVRGYVGNRFVRQRLEEIAKNVPYHVSARMLALQGAGLRPTRLSTRVLANELLMSTRTTNWIAKMNGGLEKLDSAALTELAENGREKVKSMERYAEMRDREMVDKANDLMVALRTFARTLRKRKDAEGQWIDHTADLKEFKALHQQVTEQLRLAADTPP